jgi:hypothetical protein
VFRGFVQEKNSQAPRDIAGSPLTRQIDAIRRAHTASFAFQGF